MDILLVHGYNVTSTQTYGVLPQRLKSAGHNVKDVYLSKYVTLDNELSLPDLIKAFQVALEDVYGSKLGKSRFACVTHSTGGLVIRSWITAAYQDRMRLNPLSHLVLLSPPNHGSRLASLGKSRLSRLRSLWGVEPGLKILDALEMGSLTQWNLNSSWIENETAAAAGFYPFVITGQWIDKKVWDVIVPATYERGSDGVVRACSANLNMKKISVASNGKVKESVMGDIPFLITPQTSHSDEDYGIMGSIPAKGDHPVLSAILEALSVNNRASHQALAREFKKRTDELQKTEKYHDGSPLDRYSQLVIRVTDTGGNSLQDYALELLDRERKGDRFPSGFLAHSFQNSVHPEQFVYYLNTDQVSKVVGGRVGFRIQSTVDSPLVAYDDFYFEGSASGVSNLLQPNQTTYVEVVTHRKLNKNVFRLTKNFAYQKIERKPGPDWID